MSEISEPFARELAKQNLRKDKLCAELTNDLVGVESILFEAGCGHGHWLTNYAESYPDTICVGIDLISWRVRKCNEKKSKRGLKNLYFYKAELSEFLEVLPESVRIERTVLLFPDPWPKARHHRRRMIQANLLDELACRSDRGGELCFRSDDRPYFDWTIQHLNEHNQWLIEPSANWPYESATYFQDFMDKYFSVVAKRV